MQFKGVQKALENFARHFGSKLFEVLPELWLEISSVFKQLEAFSESSGETCTHTHTACSHTHTCGRHTCMRAHVHKKGWRTGDASRHLCLLLPWTRSVQIPLLHSAYCSRLLPPESFPGSVQGDVQHCLSKLQVLRTLCSCVHPDLGEQVGTLVSGTVLTCTCVFQISLAVLHSHVHHVYDCVVAYPICLEVLERSC